MKLDAIALITGIVFVLLALLVAVSEDPPALEQELRKASAAAHARAAAITAPQVEARPSTTAGDP